MNKKNLSVVMAGAMLATSVAPVLADTTTDEKVYEVSKSNVGLLIDRIEDMISKGDKFASDDKSITSASSTGSTLQTTNSGLAGKSIYNVEYRIVGSSTWTKVAADNDTTTASAGLEVTTLRNTLKGFATDANEYEVRIVDRGHRTVNGRIVSTEGVKYTATELNAIYNNGTGDTNLKALIDKKVVEKVEYDATAGKEKLTLTLAAHENGVNKTIVLTTDSTKLDLTKPVDKDGNVINVNDIDPNGTKVNPSTVVGFDEPASMTYKDIEDTVLYNVKLVKGTIREEVSCDDLYDGFMLTEKGHEILRTIKEVYNDGLTETTQTVSGLSNTTVGSIKTFTITFADTRTGYEKVITVKGDNQARMSTLQGWYAARKATVDILAGSNRYATAVEIAKEYVASQYAPGTSTGNETSALNTLKNIVMVNGTALVDGLAAAPYAKQKSAPILLTAENSLPKETRDYLKELVAEYKVSNLPEITIVGGEAVVSSNVVNELKDLGFKVKRIAGDNREETSLAVAQKITGTTKAFVVGAEGEADAMSIAPEAAKSGNPIIVSKSTKGLSTVGLNALSDYTNVEIIGGEVAVSKSDEEKIKELVDTPANVTRIAGKNRQETNAMIISKYHSGFTTALVAKDGTNDKSELVDALPVSIFASSTAGTASPIVLATNNLSNEQLNKLSLNASATGASVYQIGGGVSRTVMNKVVEKLGLAK